MRAFCLHDVCTKFIVQVVVVAFFKQMDVIFCKTGNTMLHAITRCIVVIAHDSTNASSFNLVRAVPCGLWLLFISQVVVYDIHDALKRYAHPVGPAVELIAQLVNGFFKQVRLQDGL